ncbi:MAG: Maf family protein [Verrucomicrobiota bacterium]|jgi:septum formation protein
METPTLILASASPRRAELLRQLRPRFEVVPSDAAEVHDENLSAVELAQVNAYRKARAVSKKFPDALILGVDTLVSLGRQLFGKPRTLDEAHGMLLLLQGQTHQVTTGVCLIYLRDHRQKTFYEQTDVKFRPLTLSQIRRYHQLVNPLDKAGAYAIQEHAGALVESVESISGSFSNVVGLPLERLRVKLDAFLAGLAARPTAIGLHRPPPMRKPEPPRLGL